MPIIKRGSSKSKEQEPSEPKKLNGAGIKKRIPAKQKLIYTSKEGLLIVKTPAETTRWPADFRMQIVRDYIPPKTLIKARTFFDKYIDNGGQENIYRVGGHEVLVRHPFETIDNTAHVVVLQTEVVDLQQGKSMFLYHDAPAMRCLMVYAFLKNEVIPGMPKLNIYEYKP